MISVEKSTLDSLIFYYFGFTLDQDSKCILEGIIEKAYADATKQGAFNIKANLVKEKFANCVEISKSSAKEALINQLNELLKPKHLNFDAWHYVTCQKLISIYTDNNLEDVFTYGNAQKWVNMSVKYIYLLGGISDEYANSFSSMAKGIREYSTELHIPIDSYIIDALWKNTSVSLPGKEGVNARREYSYKNPNEYVKGWSNWSCNDYKKLRESLKNLEYSAPIEWESRAWIERAKERKR